ncbi:unnamed protein product, partial [Prorocentrum cordatum]
QAKHANEREEAAASGADEPAQGIVDPGLVVTKLTDIANAGDEEVAVEDATRFHGDDVLFIKSSGDDGHTEHNRVKVQLVKKTARRCPHLPWGELRRTCLRECAP